MHVPVWQMYLRLSARPSVSISPDRVLTTVQHPLSMCRAQWKSSQTIPPTAPFYGVSSFAFPFILRRPIFFILFISFQPIKVILFFKFHSLLHLPKPHLLFYLSTLCHNPCPQHFTPSYPTVHNPPMHNPHISCSTAQAT